MGKSKNFSGQPIFNQLIKFIDKREIKKIAKQHGAERYVKKFNTYNHVIVMLFVAFEGYHSIREAILGLLANAHKLSHLGLSYLVRRSTFNCTNRFWPESTFLRYFIFSEESSKMQSTKRCKFGTGSPAIVLHRTLIRMYKSSILRRKPLMVFNSGKCKLEVKTSSTESIRSSPLTS